jgi:hypothetical protein
MDNTAIHMSLEPINFPKMMSRDVKTEAQNQNIFAHQTYVR